MDKKKTYLNRIASTGCILCRHFGLGETPGQVHHLKINCGASQRESDWLTVNLCWEHHQGNSGYHQLRERGFYTRYKLSELDLLAMQIEAMNS